MLYYYLWYFIIFSFFGWCIEVGFHAIKSKRFVNRGFLSGPLCPIYGTGVVAAGLLLGGIKNIFLLFLASMAVATAVELIVGFLMDKMFKSKWWDYSSEKYNLYGYICPKFSVAWGLLCSLSVKLLIPARYFVSLIDNIAGYVIIGGLLLLLLFDVASTSVKVVKFNKRLMRLDQIADDISGAITQGSDFIGTGVYKGTVKIYREYEKVLAQAAILGMRIIDAFPSFKSQRYNDQLKVIRERLSDIRDKRQGDGGTETDAPDQTAADDNAVIQTDAEQLSKDLEMPTGDIGDDSLISGSEE